VDLSLILRFRGSTRLVLSLHGADVRTYPRRSRVLRFALKQLCASADAVVTCSTSLLHDVLEYLPPQSPRLAVLRNGIDPQDFEAPVELPRHSRPFIFTAGRFVKEKGFHLLLQVLPLVLEEYPAIDLLIAGEGEEAEFLTTTVAALGLAGRVRFLGPLPNREVIHWMMESELFVLPSIVESLGIVCLEAMAAGKAVVATKVGGVPEVVVDGVTGILVPPEDPRALAGAIVTLLKNPEQRERMGEAGRQRVIRDFTWARYVDNLVPLLASEQEVIAS
jgi:starch synthase